METAVQELIDGFVNEGLQDYGVNSSDGRLAWFEPEPIEMELTGYMEDRNQYLHDLGPLTDFVVETRITWSSTSGFALCGITFRANEDLELGAQNRFFMMRLEFDPGWTIWGWENGQFQYFLPGDWLSSRSIHDENGSSNLVALVVRGDEIEVFINRDKQRLVTDNKREQGLLALSAYQESGETNCQFENSWVWVFDR
jgi:hypothetical protein